VLGRIYLRRNDIPLVLDRLSHCECECDKVAAEQEALRFSSETAKKCSSEEMLKAEKKRYGESGGDLVGFHLSSRVSRV
jgi:hypothetical protein